VRVIFDDVCVALASDYDGISVRHTTQNSVISIALSVVQRTISR
jgi:hypothetical protein